MTDLSGLIIKAKKKYTVSDEGLAEMLRAVDVQCTGRAVAAWRTGERAPDHNALMWILHQLKQPNRMGK